MDVDILIYLILAIFIVFGFTIFALLQYSGLFYSPPVATSSTPWAKAAKIAYKFIQGPYNSNDVGSTFTEVTCIAHNAAPIGIFYDNPREIEGERLRCAVGCILIEKLNEPDEQRFINDQQMKLFEEKGYKFCTIPSVDLAVTSDFVYTTPLSIWLAPSKVYPQVAHYIKERGLCAYPMIEVYRDGKILYAAPLSKQEDFFVDECNQRSNDHRGRSNLPKKLSTSSCHGSSPKLLKRGNSSTDIDDDVANANTTVVADAVTTNGRQRQRRGQDNGEDEENSSFEDLGSLMTSKDDDRTSGDVGIFNRRKSSTSKKRE